MSDDALIALAKVDAAAAKKVVAGDLPMPLPVPMPIDLEDDGFVTLYASPPAARP